MVLILKHLLFVINKNYMQIRQENYRRMKYLDSQSNARKYAYLNDQNADIEHKARILETISQQAISEEKGSATNRSQLINEQQRIQKNLSQRYIKQNDNNQWLPENQIPIKSARTSQNIPQNTQNNIKNSGFQKKTHRQSIHAQVAKSFTFTDHNQQNISQKSPVNYKLGCQQCSYYSFKISELQNSYELLLSAKNQQVEECKIIIFGLQEKLMAIQKRSQQQLEKNKKMRAQFEKRNFEQVHLRQKENEMMDYLKNREIVLMQQIKQLQNQMFISRIRTKQSIKDEKLLSKKSSSQSNPVNFPKSPVYLNMENQIQQKMKDSHIQGSVSDYSANTEKSQMHSVTQRHHRSCFQSQEISCFKTLGKHTKNDLIEKVPLTQILIKKNQIQSLKDDLLVSQLKTKIQQTKNLQKLYLVR